ncbi:MAG: DUF4290 domain-containing protein [Bacteroidetes bacterium]|nr:MAG: DUF4290 domain-containing protein [Bacteroidota bacterium]
MMKYKISNNPLILREYGRNIQAMVEYAKTIEDRQKRNKLAYEIVQIMSNLNPQLKEIPDYKQKLWDHLFIISGFDLDVDAPYPMPEPEAILGRPTEKMPYYTGRPRYRQYGWNVELMIQEAIKMPEGPQKDAYINQIANTMKMFLRSMDRETTPEEVIAEHINEISKGKLHVSGENLTFTKSTLNYKHSRPTNGHSNNNNKKSRKKKSHKNRRKRY